MPDSPERRWRGSPREWPVLQGMLPIERSRVPAEVLAGLGFEHREQAAFGGQPGDLDRVGRGAGPAERAGTKGVQVAGARKSIARVAVYSRSRRSATVAVAT